MDVSFWSRRADVQADMFRILPFMADLSSTRRRAAGYRLMRYLLDRSTWAKMLQAGIEWLVVR
jgi:rapamycin-insensitive companion of mTOR